MLTKTRSRLRAFCPCFADVIQVKICKVSQNIIVVSSMPTALITGASAGIGAAFAHELAARQTNLVLVARSEAKLQQLAQQLQEKYKIQINVLVQDLTEPAAATDVFDTVTQKGLTIDLLINNAGFGDYGSFAELDGERQVKMIQLNILALVDLTHKFLPGMRQRRSGGIINMSSTAAFQPMPYFSVYAASKAFVLSFSEAMSAENSNYGVRVLAVCPGPTETDFFQDAKFPPFLASVAAGNYTPTEVVVRQALQALEKNQSTVVPGAIANQLSANLPRFLPRETVVSLWKNILGARKN